jgi:WhiB family redox-sensing transcriptional regulator
MTVDEFPPTTVDLPPQYRLTPPDNREDNPRAWMDQGLCTQTDPEAFFPEKGGSVRDGKRICEACDVRSICLQWALDHHEDRGIWGGLSPKQRARLRNRRAA